MRLLAAVLVLVAASVVSAHPWRMSGRVSPLLCVIGSWDVVRVRSEELITSAGPYIQPRPCPQTIMFLRASFILMLLVAYAASAPPPALDTVKRWCPPGGCNPDCRVDPQNPFCL
ncbi:hypothetical protein EXIGLDRAFT_807356 [Exidia glandulosa HHB12029]|uniref:Uncharacterized protein n=1 Tax=Exidia glandulosa HHB12029 TaxID=1314781 RepID=A0A165DAM7_EXIGL|nr:hypothetical protein EXIGLDRAFT_807356 [Exidia glandulosa HHB12029]